jgi:cytochrome P450
MVSKVSGGREAEASLASKCPVDIVEWTKHFDPRGDDDLREDPYPFYAAMRDQCPVAWNEDYQYWAVTRYEDVFAVMRDAETFSSAQIAVPALEEPAGPRIPLAIDPPLHTDFRRLLLPLFSPGRVEQMMPMIKSTSVRLLESIRDKGESEFVRDYAIPLPFEVMLTWLGIPRDGWEFIMEAEDSGIRLFAADPEARARSIELKEAVNPYFESILADRQKTGPIGPDVMSYLVSAEIYDRPLTMSEMLRISMLSFSAGLHSTTSTLGMMIASLGQRLELRDRLVADPTLIPSAVEELMRFESLGTFTRTALKDTVVGGQPIKKGDVLQVLSTSNVSRTGTSTSESGLTAAWVRTSRVPSWSFRSRRFTASSRTTE